LKPQEIISSTQNKEAYNERRPFFCALGEKLERRKKRRVSKCIADVKPIA